MAKFDIDTCKWVIWGAKVSYNTFGHIHSSFLKALKYLGKEAYWIDPAEGLAIADFSNTLFLSMNCVIEGMPRRDDCFYVVHNINGTPEKSYFDGLKLLPYGIHISTNRYPLNTREVQKECFYVPGESLSMRWGTDLLPEEIRLNKPAKIFNFKSKVVHWVGSVDSSKDAALNEFSRAAAGSGVEVRRWGGFSHKVRPTDHEHMILVQNSYMAPAFQERGQNETGYIACRLFKNISYGQMGLTQSRFAQDLFNGRLIYQPDAYHLFYEAKEYLEKAPVSALWDLMDEVAKNHTYLNKVAAIEYAVRDMQ